MPDERHVWMPLENAQNTFTYNADTSAPQYVTVLYDPSDSRETNYSDLASIFVQTNDGRKVSLATFLANHPDGNVVLHESPNSDMGQRTSSESARHVEFAPQVCDTPMLIERTSASNGSNP